MTQPRPDSRTLRGFGLLFGIYVSKKFALIKSIESGVYTPTLTNTTNVAASTAYECSYLRVGSVVHVSGVIDVDPTATALTVLGISLPVPSNLTNHGDLGGTAAGISSPQDVAAVVPDFTNNRAEFRWVTTEIGNHSLYFTFSYRII